MELITKFIQKINVCLVPKLSKNYEESSKHVEIVNRNINLEKNFQSLVDTFSKLSKIDFEKYPIAIAYLLSLYKELSCDSPWNTTKAKELSEQLNYNFENKTSLSIDLILRNNHIFNSQMIFDKYLDILHSKVSYETFKMYPAQVDTYVGILWNLQEYDINLMPSKLFPIILLLIEDCYDDNKIKGLTCCKFLLQCMKEKNFENGNYYEVIYRSLKKIVVESNIDVIKLKHDCLAELIKITPDKDREEMLNKLYSNTLDQILIESNLYKKAAYFNFTATIIDWHKLNCANMNSFKEIIIYNLDICTNDAVSEIVLSPLLRCLEKWIIHCWPIWKFKSDHKVLISLLKVLYTCNENCLVAQLHTIIVTLITLCTKTEQIQIISNLNKKQDIECDVFSERVKKINEDLKAYIDV